MGSSTPKIYLAGWLALSPHRRKVLMDRHVVPIDLAHHPMATGWPESLRHPYATEWILHTLELGRPYDLTDWPMPSESTQASVREVLRPVELPPFDEPQEEPPIPSSADAKEQPVEAVRGVLSAWTHNRKTYPGWLTVPGVERDKMSRATNGWEPRILSAAPALDPIDRLNAIRELVWRREALLDPISSELEQAANDVLQAVDCRTRTMDGIDCLDVSWTPIREAWRTVALALVTVARQRFDHESLEQRIDSLSSFVDDHDDVQHRIFHERSLWALYAMDFKKLSAVLDGWATDFTDPVWMMRKAAILAEANRSEEANRLIRLALNDIRMNPGDDLSLAAPSREGWALFLAEAFEGEPFDWAARERRLKRYYRRSAELAVLHCDALEEKRICAERMRSLSRDDEPNFDDGTPRNRIVFSEVPISRVDAARRAVRLTEVAALPPVANRVAIAQDILELAADELLFDEPRLASCLVLRMCHFDGDPILKRVLSKTRVAAMSAGAAEAIAQSCVEVMDYALPRVRAERGIFWIERLRVAIEVLSRVGLRRRLDHVVAAFDKAMQYYMNETMGGHIWLTDPIRNLFTRSWAALPESHRTDRVLDLLAAPIVGMNGFRVASRRRDEIDPGELLRDEVAAPPRARENDNRWTMAVSLLTQGLRSGGEARRRASIRIGYAGLYERLTEGEKSQVADALWHPSSDSLPVGTVFPDWAFALFPEPRLGLTEEKFRARWLDRATINFNLSGPKRKSYVPSGG